MERVFIKCSEIKKLEYEIENKNINAVNDFWSNAQKKGTPLVESFDGSNEYDLVTIVYREKEKLNNVTLIPPVGMRNLVNCVMDKVTGTDVWYIAYKVKNDISFTYQFSENDPLDKDWNRRWKNVKGDIYNKKSILHYDKSINKERMVPYVNLKNARKKKYIYKSHNIQYGNIIEKSIYSNVLNEERKIHIYIPYNYSENNIYPLAILNDGKEYLNILNAKNIFDNLIYSKKIKPVIGVFIESTDNRKQNLSCNHKYAEFLADEVTKYVKNDYNISSNPADNIIGGYSLGGLQASYTALMYSSIFGNVLSQSGSYWFERDAASKRDVLWIIRKFIEKGKRNINFYINVGAIEPKVSMINTNIKFKDFLIDNGYNVFFDMFGSGHDYLFWDETLADGLIKLLN